MRLHPPAVRRPSRYPFGYLLARASPLTCGFRLQQDVSGNALSRLTVVRLAAGMRRRLRVPYPPRPQIPYPCAELIYAYPPSRARFSEVEDHLSSR